MKNISKSFFAAYSIIVLFLSVVLITGCSQPSNPPAIPVITPVTTPTTDEPTTPENPTSPENPVTPTSPENPSSPQQRVLMILSPGHERNFSVNTWEDIDFVGSSVDEWSSNFTNSSDCEIEIKEQGNSSNINLQANVTATKVSIKADKTGIVYFRVKNNRANIVSNYTMVNFISNSANSNNPNCFYGTWITTDTYLIDTIIFNQNGSGEQYNSNYSTSRTNISWYVTNASTIHITSDESSCDATYSFSENFQTLRLTNLWDYNQTLTFTKQ
jgi:hypothetical protein